jgi:ABC-2 type transport system permease protein
VTTLLSAHTEPTAPVRLRLIRAEIMKIRTTNTWWLFLIGMFVVTALAVTVNGIGHHYDLYPQPGARGDNGQSLAAQAVYFRTHAGLAKIAADMMTSGQYFGSLFAMLIGILVITNEFFHQTATATFMTNPHRTAVIMAKLAAAVSFAVLFWLLSTVIDTVVTPIYLHSQHVSISLTDSTVLQSVGLNLLAFVMWAIFGVGLGTLIRSQIGSVVTGMAAYLIGEVAVALIFQLIYHFYQHSIVLAAGVIAPAVAAQVMTSPTRVYDHAAPQWVGLLVMIGYAVVMGGIGVALTRRRDVS